MRGIKPGMMKKVSNLKLPVKKKGKTWLSLKPHLAPAIWLSE
jgi:hypothetical protein